MTRKQKNELNQEKEMYFKIAEQIAITIFIIIVIATTIIFGVKAYKTTKPVDTTEEEVSHIIEIARKVNENGVKSVSNQIRNIYSIEITSEQTMIISNVDETKKKVYVSFIDDEINVKIGDGNEFNRHIVSVILSSIGGAIYGFLVGFIVGLIIEKILKKIITVLKS